MTWIGAPLGSAGDWLSGGTPSKQHPEFWVGSIPWVSPKDMKRSRISDAMDHVSENAAGNGTQFAPTGSLLMVVRGMILAHTFPVALTTAPVTFNQDIKALVPAPGWSAEFLLYWLQYSAPDVLRLVDVANHGTKRLPSERLFGLTLLRPPLGEQRKIAAILSSVDDAIEATQAVIDQLQVVKKAMMAELLTRGLPGRHTRFKQTEIGDVPDDWKVASLGDLSTFVTSGSRGWAQYYSKQGPLFVRITNLERGTTRLDLSDRQHVCLPAGSTEGIRTRVEPGDVLISITADLGIIGLVPLAGVGEAYVNQHIAMVRLDRTKADPRYIANVLAGNIGCAQVKRLNDGGTKAGLSLPSIRQLIVPLPPPEEQWLLAEPIEEAEDRLVVEREGLEALRIVKSALMSVLLTGEVRVTLDEAAA